MKLFAAILLLALTATGCVTRSQADAMAKKAFLEGQNAALRQQQLEQNPVVTVVGAVQNPQVPWVAGMTLAQAIASTSRQSGVERILAKLHTAPLGAP